MDAAVSAAKKKTATIEAFDTGVTHTTRDHHTQQLKTLAPDLMILLKDAELISKPDSPDIRSASDFSYAATNYAGDHYRLVGDGAGM